MSEWLELLQAVGNYGGSAIDGVKRDRDGALVLAVVGGAIGFFVAGPVGGAKGALIGASLLSDRSASVPHDSRLVEESARPTGQRAAISTSSEPDPLPPAETNAQPVAWVESRGHIRPEYQSARPWILEAQGMKFGLMPGRTYTLGRDDSCDIRFLAATENSCGVSRKHASVLVFDDGLYVLDENSTNGTYVGDARVRPGTAFVMRKRSQIQLGAFGLVVAPI